jgi:hypothetical protein
MSHDLILPGDRPAKELMETIKVTPQMIEVGEDVLLSELGGAVSSHWNARELAILVYRAMAVCSHSRRVRLPLRNSSKS